jgi:hypothetical protein
MPDDVDGVENTPGLASPGAGLRWLPGAGGQLQCLSMTDFTELASAPSDPPVPFTDQLRLAVAAYLARFTGSSRKHTESDLCCYLIWCTEQGLNPLAAQRPGQGDELERAERLARLARRAGPGQPRHQREAGDVDHRIPDPDDEESQAGGRRGRREGKKSQGHAPQQHADDQAAAQPGDADRSGGQHCAGQATRAEGSSEPADP